jgi:hypothetical protein
MSIGSDVATAQNAERPLNSTRSLRSLDDPLPESHVLGVVGEVLAAFETDYIGLVGLRAMTGDGRHRAAESLMAAPE